MAFLGADILSSDASPLPGSILDIFSNPSPAPSLVLGGPDDAVQKEIFARMLPQPDTYPKATYVSPSSDYLWVLGILGGAFLLLKGGR